MAKIIERTPAEIERDRRLAAQARERLIQNGIIRFRPGMSAELIQAPKRPERKVPVVVNPFIAGKFDPVKAAEKAQKMQPGRKTNIGAGTAKGPGGTKPGRGTSNPKLAAKRARKAAQRK